MDPFIGEIRMFAGNYAPQDWAFCNGQLLPIAQYQALFAILGKTYGGDGIQNFALPNLQGRVPIHVGQSTGTSSYPLGKSAGIESVVLNASQLPAHVHSVALTGNGNATVAQGVSTANGNTAVPGPTTVAAKVASGLSALNCYSSAAPDTTLLPATGTASVSISGNTAATGAGSPVPVVQPYLAVNFIIALIGIFPPHS